MDDHYSDRTSSQRQGRMEILMRLWPLTKRILTLLFLTLVAWLLIRHAQTIDWGAVKTSLSDYAWSTIAVGCLLAAGSYLAYASYDLFGRYYVRHGISRPQTMAIAFICCAFTLNLGALIGSIGFRYRMYSQRGVSKGDIAHIVGMTITTNWLGYILLTGLVLVSGSVVVPFDWEISNRAMRGLGGVFLTVVLVYFLFCRFARTRSWELRGQTITLPSTRIALAQLLVAGAHWLFMGAAMFTFLYGEVGYFTLLGVLLVSSIAGIISHVPGALGVLEAVFLAFLGDEIGPSVLVAALIAYRAVFYLWPLVMAVLVYGLMEFTGKKHRKRSARPRPDN